MAQTGQFTIRIDNQLKEKALRVAEKKFGMSLAALTKHFYEALIGKKNVSILLGEDPFDIALDKALQSESVRKSFERLAKAVRKKRE